MSRHTTLCTALDDAKAALRRRDYAAADRIRDAVLASGEHLSGTTADVIGDMIAAARGQEPWAPVAELRRVA